MVYFYNGILLISQKEQTLDTGTIAGESEKHYVEHNKLNAKEYLFIYLFIYLFYFIYLFIFCFSGLHLQHMEFPG